MWVMHSRSLAGAASVNVAGKYETEAVGLAMGEVLSPLPSCSPRLPLSPPILSACIAQSPA